MSQAEQAARYEQYVRENWDRMSSFEQEQARSYFTAKQQAVMQPNLHAVSSQARYDYAQSANGISFSPYAAPRKEKGSVWAVWVGYITLFFFTPVAFGCGIYNLVKGRPIHGVLQIVLAVCSAIIGVMMMMPSS